MRISQLPALAACLGIGSLGTPGTSAPSRPTPPAQSTQPATTPAVTPPPTIAGIGTMPPPGVSATPQPGVTSVTNPGNIGDLLPVITPGANASAAADNSARTGVTAEAHGIVVLLVFAVMAFRLRAADNLFARVQPGRASSGAQGGPSPLRRLKPSAILHLRRQRSGSPDKAP